MTVHHGVRRKLVWQVDDVARLDYTHYLPLFFHGLRNKTEPYAFLAFEGTKDMLVEAPDRVLICVPDLIQPLKLALNTRDPAIVSKVLEVVVQCVSLCDMVGESLVPYFRQLLPVLSILKHDGRQISRGVAMSDRVNEALMALEMYGGPDAFVNIKYMIPTYESCKGPYLPE